MPDDLGQPECVGNREAESSSDTRKTSTGMHTTDGLRVGIASCDSKTLDNAML